MPIPSAGVLGKSAPPRPDASEPDSYTLAVLAGEMSPEQVRDVVLGNAGDDVRVVAVSSVATVRVDGMSNVLSAVLAAAAKEVFRESAEGAEKSEHPQERKRARGDDEKRDPETEQEKAPLSARERETLLLVADGLTRNQTARRIGISPHTVDTYLKRIRAKLGLGNKAELARVAEHYRTDGDDRR
ncbi:helix-turn-helix domain-containing protein [Streptomyces similanensis]|uniref:helix-turn-helix domain-containing protein n=1 Tax=Streptomyces similanensis TaxID=1274988 RepID=UPI0031EFF4A7